MNRIGEALAVVGAGVIVGGATALIIEAVGDPTSTLVGVVSGLVAAIAGAVAAKTLPPPPSRRL